MSFPKDKWFEKFLEDQERMAKTLAPFQEPIQHHQKLIDSLNFNSLDHYNDIFESANIKGHLLSAGISEQLFSTQTEIENSFGSISSISKELEFLSASSQFESIMSAHESLYRLQDQFASTIDFPQLPSERIESVLATAEATARLYNVNHIFPDITLFSIAQYQNFIEKQYKCLQFDSDIVAQRRVEIAEMSGGIFELANASIELGATMQVQMELEDDEQSEGSYNESSIYSHVNQHIGFVYSPKFEGDVESSFKKSLPAKISQLGFSITEKIYQINTICEHKGQEPIFKPTSLTMRACASLPTTITKNEIGFNVLIDHLFFLIYEGSGTAKRLTNFMDITFLDPLWKVKHIRLNARHDINHGSQREIEKKKEKINNTFMSLINKPLPIMQKDWQTAQLQLYIEIDLMLQNVINIIIAG